MRSANAHPVFGHLLTHQPGRRKQREFPREGSLAISRCTPLQDAAVRPENRNGDSTGAGLRRRGGQPPWRTLFCISGDQFWYENVFSGEQLQDTDSTTLADVIERNGDVTGLLDNVFFAPQVQYVNLEDSKARSATVRTSGGDLEVVNNRNRETISRRPLEEVEQVGNANRGLTSPARPTFCRNQPRLLKIEPVEIHHFVPRRRKVLHEFLLTVLAGVHFRDRSQLGIRTEDQIDSGAGPLQFIGGAITPFEFVLC